MEAPEKIYLQVCGDCNNNDCENCKFEDLEDNVTWCKDKIFDKDIEYTRTDAFIKKACEWLSDNLQTIRDGKSLSKHHVETIPALGSITQTEFLEKFKKEVKYLFD